MFSSPFFRRLFLPCLLLICAAVGTVGFFAAKQMRETYIARTEADLVDRSRLVELLIGESLGRGDVDRVQALLAEVHRAGGARVTVMDLDGVVLADNEADPRHMENHGNRPEIVAAAKNGVGSTIRDSATVHFTVVLLRTEDRARPGVGGRRMYYLRAWRSIWRT